MTEQVALPAETEFFKLLQEAGGGYVDALHKLMNSAQQTIDKREGRTTIAGRKAIWKQAIVEFDEEKLLEMQEIMTDFVDTITKTVIVPTEEPRLLEVGEQKALMERHLAFLKMDEFLSVYRELTKALVFQHITEQYASEKDEDGNPVYEHPEHVNGSIVVKELGKKFTKEGTGRKAPTFDQAKLEQALGDQWKECLEVIEHPAQDAWTEVRFSEDKLGALMVRSPKLIDKVKDAVVPGAWKTPKFCTRNA